MRGLSARPPTTSSEPAVDDGRSPVGFFRPTGKDDADAGGPHRALAAASETRSGGVIDRIILARRDGDGDEWAVLESAHDVVLSRSGANAGALRLHRGSQRHPSSTGRFCPHCGLSDHVADASFCTGCGGPLYRPKAPHSDVAVMTDIRGATIADLLERSAAVPRGSSSWAAIPPAIPVVASTTASSRSASVPRADVEADMERLQQLHRRETDGLRARLEDAEQRLTERDRQLQLTEARLVAEAEKVAKLEQRWARRVSTDREVGELWSALVSDCRRLATPSE